MFSGSPVYSPGDNYPGQVRPMTRDVVPSSWTPTVILGATGRMVALTAGIALGLIWFVGRRK
jgi:hypothetical protein